MAILIYLIIAYVLFSVTMQKLFEKAGVEGWKALVPGLNFVEMCKIVGRKPAHALWLLFPIVNIFIFVGLCVDIVRSFGKYDFKHSALAVIYPAIIFYQIGKEKHAKYLGPAFKMEKEFMAKLQKAEAEGNKKELKKLHRINPYQKGQAREWAEAIIFAVFAAAFIRMFLIEAYVIPTSSMEGSLKVGDYLFVSKAHYGIRTPKTVLMFPLLHNRLPFVNAESYVEKPNLPFYRLPAIQEVERYDPVVFNFPDGDSVYVFPERTYSINDYRRGAISKQRYDQIRNGQAELVTRPIDKKDHYIKRCVGLPGDSIQIINRQVYANGEPLKNAPGTQFKHRVQSESGAFSFADLDDMGVNMRETGFLKAIVYVNNQQIQELNKLKPNISFEPADKPAKDGLSAYQLAFRQNGAGCEEASDAWGIDYENFDMQVGEIALSEAHIQKLKSFGNDISIEPIPDAHRPGALFPHDEKNFPGWTVDNYGPIYIPKKGETVKISPSNISLYRRVITIYEGNDLEIKGGKIHINGEPTDTYTFQMDYYWMMGDNRHNSEDSRVWGYVPADHVVGKPLFIWFSTKNARLFDGINFDRIFTGATKME